MQYHVPQFIEVEDKIVGPLSLRQFIYIAGGVGISAVFVTLLPLFFGILASIPFVVLAAGLAFYKVNNKTLLEVIEDGFFFFMNDKLYLWKHKDGVAKPEHPKDVVSQVKAAQTEGRIGKEEAIQKIHSLALALDIDNQQQYGGR